MSKWRIIIWYLGNGITEDQVSDVDVGERTVAIYFDNIYDAEDCLREEIEREEHE